MLFLFSQYLINSVLRQARRLSKVSGINLVGNGEEPKIQNCFADISSQHQTTTDNGPTEITPPEALQSSPESKPLSSSTPATRVGETVAMAHPEAPDRAPATQHDHLGFPISPPRITQNIPDDDGMGEMRCKIQAINGRDIPSADKARLMHNLLLEGYRASRITSLIGNNPQSNDIESPSWEQFAAQSPLESFKFWQNQAGETAAPEKFILTKNDVAPTFAPIRRTLSFIGYPSGIEMPSGSCTTLETQPPLGCQHYERNVKSECSTCKKWYACAFCHDNQEDHKMVRNQTRNMLCMLCGTPQKASDVCIRCGELAAQYYCNICKLWENRSTKPIYHCNDCGICRRGMGLGRDFIHCKTCCACIPVSMETSHKCIERSTDCDCPICGDYMFTSPKPVVFMTCGHSIHKKCYEQHMRVSYKCPICNKSLTNMDAQFRNIDAAIQTQPMPPEFRDTKAVVLCNDCSGKSTVSFHWLGLKCSICSSYNTVELQMLGRGSQELQAVIAERAVPAMESNAPEASDTARTMIVPAEEREAGIAIENRRRHSLQAIGASRRNTTERLGVIGSLPSYTALYNTNLTAFDVDSEDDMLGFWRSGGEEESSGCDNDNLAEEEEKSDESDADDDEDDEEDNEILLIGHR